jgi:hypothetical protein
MESHIMSKCTANSPSDSDIRMTARRNRRLTTVALTLLVTGLIALDTTYSSRVSAQSRLGSATRPQVWFHPNAGSEDFLRLFTEPESWAHVRDRIDVFGFGYTALRETNPAATRLLGPNTWPAIQRADAVRKLSAWGKAIGVTVQPIQAYPSPPPAVENGQKQALLTLGAIDNVYKAGGKVQYISMDEPLRFSAPDFNNYSYRDTVQGVKTFIEDIHAKYPEIQIGEYMPYPRFSLAQIEQWINALTAAGVPPAFEHVDLNYQFLMQPRQGVARARFAADLPALAAFCRQQRIPFGIVFTTTNVVNSSQQFFVQTRQSMQFVQPLLRPLPDHLIFQSWAVDMSGQKTYPANLPETGNSSLSYLVKTSLGL